MTLGLALLVSGGSYGQTQDHVAWPWFAVGAQTGANGELRAEILPNVELRSRFVVDCSNPDPSKHTLLAGAQFIINTFGLPGQLLTAETITAIQVITVEKPLFAQLLPADLTTSSAGSTTVIEPKLKTSGGQTKICTDSVQLGAAEDYIWTIEGPSKVPNTADKYSFRVRAFPKTPGGLPVIVQYKWIIVWAGGTVSPTGASPANPGAGANGTTGNPVNVQRPANEAAGGTATLYIYARDAQGNWVQVASSTFTQ